MPDDNQPTPKSILDQLKEWKELIAFIAAGLTSVLGVFFAKGLAQTVSWGIAVIAVGVGSLLVRGSWLRRKRKADQEKLWTNRKKQTRATFRSLAPFEEQDELPGQDRKQQARSIAIRIVSDDFRFGILCGDSGAGKTSLLRSEIMRCIRANGLEPVYLRNPRRLAKESPEDNTAYNRLKAELEAFKKECIPEAQCVLILDQFEEWFVEYREPNVRALIGRFISSLTKRKEPVRVVCAIRREFLMDFHDLASELPDPTNPNNTFRVRNFTVLQAIDVISQCAATDGVLLEDTFSKTIANDLADNGEVRPPELQIVCTYLAEVGGLNASSYQSAGGTSGILAHHIKDALESCREPTVGAKLLRALCDFPTRTKRKSKTVDELTAAIGAVPPRAGEQGEAIVGDLVRTFVLARLLSEEKRPDAPQAFVLMHDYLVGAVELATSDVSTQTEDANQLLRYYLAQKREVIPLLKLWFIHGHADKPLLKQQNARRLIQKSLIAPVLYAGATVIAALVLACSLYLLATANIQWRRTEIGRHWNNNESGGVTYQTLNETGEVIGGASLGSEHVHFWDPKSGTTLKLVDNPNKLDVSISSRGTFIILMDHQGLSGEIPRCKLVRISNGEEISLPIGSEYEISDSEQYVSYISEDANNSKNTKSFTIVLWSIEKKKAIHEVRDILHQNPDWYHRTFKFSSDGHRLIIVLREEDRNVIVLYDTTSGKKLKDLTDKDKSGVTFDLNSSTKQIFTTSRRSSEEATLQTWNLDDGEFVREHTIPLKKNDYVEGLYTRDGQYLLLTIANKIGNTTSTIFKVTDLEPIQGVMQESLKFSNDKHRMEEPVVYWRDGNDARLWEVGKEAPILLKNVKLGEKDVIVVSGNLRRAIILGEQRPVELWNLIDKRFIRSLAPAGHQHAYFSLNDSAAVVTEEEGNDASLFDVQDGTPLAQHFASESGDTIYYDSDLRRFHLWNKWGQVLRYVEGRSYFGRFVPTKSDALK